MTIHFDTITNNYEVIYVIKTVMKCYLNKIDTSLFSSPSSKFKINCHHMLIRNPMMCVKDRKYRKYI
jgi:hypothetical protein